MEIPIPNGTYDVTLHEAEIYHGGNGNGGGEGTRVFDISVQGQKVVEDLDLIAEVGHDAAWTTTVEDVEVTDGTLNISTTSKSDMSKFSAIEIRYSEPLQNGLEAYFSLDGDTPVNQVTGTEASVVGSPTSGQSGFRNTAWEFGTNETIDSTDSTVISEPLPLNGEGATVGAWINHDAITEDYSRVYHVDDGGNPDSPTNGWNIEFGGTDNTVAHQFWNGGDIGAEGQPSVSCPAGEWVFVVTVVEGSDATIYTFDEEGQIASGSGVGTGRSPSWRSSSSWRATGGTRPASWTRCGPTPARSPTAKSTASTTSRSRGWTVTVATVATVETSRRRHSISAGRSAGGKVSHLARSRETPTRH